jgi:hypothetical protein
VLGGTTVPRDWLTVETIFLALCGLADRSPDEERWPEDDWSSATFISEVKQRWNAVLDDADQDLPQLPPRPAPPVPAVPYVNPWASSGSDDPPF